MFACIYGKSIPAGVSLSEFAYAFSPLVEETIKNAVVLDVEGCEMLFGSVYGLGNEVLKRAAGSKQTGGLGCRINVALAANPDAAIHAARSFSGLTFISPGEELTALGELPIEALCFELVANQNEKEERAHRSREEILETLRLWGIRTFRDFAVLPVRGVAERLGQEGVKLQQLAGGKTERNLKLIEAAPVFENALELDHSLTELEPLAFILARLLNQLCAKLNSYALATNELRLNMKLESGAAHERILNLPYPMRDHKVFLKLLLLDTEMHPPPAPVTALAIACEPVKPRVLQNGLFIPLAPEPEKLELTLARLTKLLGSANVGSPELIDTHRPDAFCMKRFVLKAKVRRLQRKNQRVSMNERALAAPVMGFRVFRPPLRAMVQADRGYPTQINAWGVSRSVYGKVVQVAGPWRTTGDWWRADRWARDEWDVAVELTRTKGGPAGPPPQTLFRIYRDLHSGAWFVEGIYD